MSQKKLNILLWGLNAILVLLYLIPIGGLPSLFQFFGRLHPLILHFPIVLIIVSFVFEVLSRKKRNPEFVRPANVLLWFGAFSAVITAIAGYLLSLNGNYGGDSFIFHKWFGLFTAIIAASIIFIRQKNRFDRAFIPAYSILILLLIITGHFGASLTHGEGFLTNVFEEKPTLTLKLEAPIFSQIVSPILDAKCTSCHNTNKLKGELLLDSQEGIMKGGESGSVIVAGDISESRLIQNILLPQEDEGHMPPKGKLQLSNEEIKMLTWWVETGASFNENVESIKSDDPIKGIIENYFKSKEELKIDFVSPKLIASLNSESTSVHQISDDLPYLEVKIGHNASLNSTDIKSLKKIKKQIYVLDLGNSNIDKSILKELSKFKNIRRLYLDNTDLNDDMISGLGKMKNLEYLNLYGTKITEKGVSKVAQLPQLKQLFLWQTAINFEEIEVIQANYPSIEINAGLPEDSEFTKAQLVPPSINFNSTFFDDHVTVEVSYSLSGTDLYYQLDDEPSKLIENGEIEITKSTKLKLFAQKEGWEDSPPIEHVFIKVAKTELKQTELRIQPKGNYQANGVATLFDLKKGSENFKDGEWLGFNGPSVQ